MRIEVDPTLNVQALNYIQNACDNCHSSPANRYNGFLSLEHLVLTKLLVIGDPSKGRFMGSIYDNSMPGGGISAQNLQTLENWIRSMRLVPL